MDKAFSIPASSMPHIRKRLEELIKVENAIDKLMGVEKDSYEWLDYLLYSLIFTISERKQAFLSYKNKLDREVEAERVLSEFNFERCGEE